ncbi:MAG: methyltransferase domain-containing protein [Verrucomicrobia bacterium]|nr:methyltransferase domain-containing protein [Verrucomicrobiota bacterium]
MNTHLNQPLLSASARMDANYRIQRHIYDWTRRWFLLGRTRLLGMLHPKPGESILEIGCGTAWNLIQIGRAFPAVRLKGIDPSACMLATARRGVARAGLQSRIELVHGVAQHLSPEREGHDVVLLSYVLSMIPDWRGALAAAAQVVKPGGVLAVVDFGDGRRLPRLARRSLRAWLRRFHTEPRESLPLALRELGERRGTASRVEHLPGRYAFVALVEL